MQQRMKRIVPIAWGIAAALLLTATPALAAQHTWVLTGTLNGNLLQANWQNVWTDIDAFNDELDLGAAGNNPNVAAAGIAINDTWTLVVTYDDATPELSDELGLPDDPLVGTYPTAAHDWTLGGLSARTAHGNNAITYAPQTDITEPFVATLDILIISGGSPASFNGGTYDLSIITIAPDPNEAGDIGTAPGSILTGFAGTTGMADDSQFLAPPDLAVYPIQGFSVTLLDTSGGATDGQVITLNGKVDSLVAGSPGSCASFGGDTDGDTICDDVDKCPADYDITQYDLDSSGIGNACNDADDADGDEWETAFDLCPDYFDPTNACLISVPVFGLPGYLAVVGLFGLTGLLILMRGRVRA